MGKITNARALSTGVAFVAPLGTELPETAAEALAGLGDSFKNLGKLNKDGIKLTIDQTTVSLEDMNGEDVMDIITKHKVKIELTPMEFLNAAAAKEWAGAENVTASGDEVTGITLKIHDAVQSAYVFMLALKDNKAAVITVEKASMSKDTIELAFQSENGVMPSLEYTCYEGADGAKAHIYIAARS